MQMAIGQYIPNETLIHKMDPRVKIFVNILLVILIFLAPNFIASAIVAIPIFLSFFLARIQSRKLFSLLKPSLFLLLFLFLINIFILNVNDPSQSFVGNKTVFWPFDHSTRFHIQISYEAIRRSLSIFVRVYLMIIVTTLLISTTKPLDLTRGIEDLLWPLKWIKFPVHIISMIIAIALRFIPTLLIEAERIMKAQASRGVDFKNGSFKNKVKSTVTLIIPLFVSAFSKAEDLSNAMETRGYNPYAHRTRYRHYTPGWFDYIALICIIGLLALLILLRFSSFIWLPQWWG